jgi:uncharacterized SAM-binding protein YcdF (DUF218 family)
VADFGWYVFSGGGVVVCLAVAAAWAVVSGGSRASRRFLLAIAVFYCVVSAFIVPDTVRMLLARGYDPLTRQAVPEGRTAVVLLGSGSYQFRDWSENRFAVVDPIAASRLLEAARVYRLVHADYIVSSGGLIAENERNRPSGVTMAEALVRLGVPREDILVEDRSKTTHDEAVIVKDMLQSHPVDHVVLVTSQFHMRRSVGTFKAAGIDVIPAVAREPQGLDTWWEKLIPTDKGLEGSSMAAHELGGIIVYSFRGWFRF